GLQSSRRVGVVDLTNNLVLDWQDASLSTDAAVGYVRANLGRKLGGVDYSTAALVQTKGGRGLNIGNSQQRPTLAYVGGRDGLLHAICVDPSPVAMTSKADNSTHYDANTCYGRSAGEEVWALLPRVA